MLRSLPFLLLSFLIWGCNNCSNDSGGIIKHVITLEKSLSNGTMQTSTSLSNFFAIGSSSGHFNYFEWRGSTETSPSPITFTTPEYSVLSGEYLRFYVRLQNFKDFGCQVLHIDTYLNGCLFDSKIINAGVQSIGPSTVWCYDTPSAGIYIVELTLP